MLDNKLLSSLEEDVWVGIGDFVGPELQCTSTNDQTLTVALLLNPPELIG